MKNDNGGPWREGNLQDSEFGELRCSLTMSGSHRIL
jgi:hypothetical protein